MSSFKIGDRVRWWADDTLGTVIAIHTKDRYGYDELMLDVKWDFSEKIYRNKAIYHRPISKEFTGDIEFTI